MWNWIRAFTAENSIIAAPENPMPWILLILAGLFEVGWAVGLKYTEGFTKLWPSVGTTLAIILSMGLLGLAARSLPIGTAYAVWVGIGTVGTAIFGMVIFHEPATLLRILCLALIVAGALGLKLLH
jgi:quaternary ammonium compound-resistance protein SugE